jgi:hypothetical protein
MERLAGAVENASSVAGKPAVSLDAWSLVIHRAARQRTGLARRLADRRLKEWLPRLILREVGIGPDLVGDTGIEPVTSSV